MGEIRKVKNCGGWRRRVHGTDSGDMDASNPLTSVGFGTRFYFQDADVGRE